MKTIFNLEGSKTFVVTYDVYATLGLHVTRKFMFGIGTGTGIHLYKVIGSSSGSQN